MSTLPRALAVPKAQQSSRSLLQHLAFCANQTRPRSPSPPSERLNRRCTLKRRSASPPERRSAPSRGAPLRAATLRSSSVNAASPPRHSSSSRRPSGADAETSAASMPVRPSSSRARRACAPSSTDARAIVGKSVARTVRRLLRLRWARAPPIDSPNARSPTPRRIRARRRLHRVRRVRTSV